MILFDSRNFTNLLRINITLIAITLISQSVVAKKNEENGIITPSDISWLAGINMTNFPNLPVRPVGSGECPDVDCDEVTDDRCFETCGNKANPIDIYGCPEGQHWALTFDDGPSSFTPKLLDYLDEANIKATFCVMGSNVEKYPEIIKRAFDSGHQIASHTYSHPHLMSLTNEEIIYEVRATEKAIEKITGVKPTYIRPPYGEADQRVKGLLKEMGYKILLWNVDPTDYDVYMLPSAAKKIQGSFKMAVTGTDTGLNAHEDAGFISLQHDLYEESIDQIPSIIKLLKSKGYSFFTAAACNNDKNPYAPPTSAQATPDEAQSNGEPQPEVAQPEEGQPGEAQPEEAVPEGDQVLKKNDFEGNLDSSNEQENLSANSVENQEVTSGSSKISSSSKHYILSALAFVLLSIIA